MTVEVGEAAPDFELETDGGGTISLRELRGRKVVLYFYPKDDTPGCTREACAFRDAMPDFEKLAATIIGVSPDSTERHARFREKYDLPFTLASDPEQKAAKAYGVWVEKSMYGRKYMGIERSTFLIDEGGKIAAIWRKVKVPGHVDAVLDATARG